MAVIQLKLIDIYVSFEFETTGEDENDVIASLRDELGEDLTRYIYSVYYDGSCGAEIVTMPFKYPLSDESLKVIRKILGVAYDYTDFSEWGSISTHTTFTVSPRRAEPVPKALRDIPVYNAMNYYIGIIASLTAFYGYEYVETRRTYFRNHYISKECYYKSKGLYPAVFIPNYDYHGLPEYHKIEWRIPDAYQLIKFNGLTWGEVMKDFKKIVDFLYKLSTEKISERDNMCYIAMNKYFANAFKNMNVEFDFDRWNGKFLEKVLMDQLKDMERSGHLSVLGLTPKDVINTISSENYCSPCEEYEIDPDEIEYFSELLEEGM